MDTEQVISVIGRILSVVAVCNISSGIPASLKMWKTGDTEGWPTTFFAIGLCGSIGMMLYGFMISNSTLFMVNTLQATVNTYYIVTYFIHTDSKREPMMYVSAVGAYLVGLAACYFAYEDSQIDMRLNLIGSISSSVFLLMNCSTLLEVGNAVKTQSAKFDLTMLIAGMLNNALWLLYGFLLNDIFLYGPTVPFLLTGVAKFILMTLYPTSTKPKMKKKSE